MSIWLYNMLKHPLFIAFVSTLIFGILVAYFGSYFQHRNWKEQHKIANETVLTEKLFDKRAEIAKEMFYLMAEKEQCVWSIRDKGESLNKAKEAKKTDIYKDFLKDLEFFVEKNRNVTSKSFSTTEEIKIYYDMNEDSKLVINFVKILDIHADIIEILLKPELLSKQDVNKQLQDVETLKNEIREILLKRIYSLKSISLDD